MSESGPIVSAHYSQVAAELVSLFERLGYAVLVRDPETAEVLAASPEAESLMLAAEPGAVRVAASRLNGLAVRVEILREAEAEPPRLTRRQRDVAQLLAAGKRNREIAETLRISEHTVRRHLESIFRRLNVPNRTAAVAELRKGLHFPLQETDDDDDA